MLGSILSSALKIVTIPIDIVETGADIVSGGAVDRLPVKPSEIRDAIGDTMEDVFDG